VLISAVVNLDYSGGYIYQIWLYLISFLIFYSFPFPIFISVYLRFIYILSVISLLGFTIVNIFPSLIEVFPVQLNSAGATIYNFGFCVFLGGGSFFRNTSIFREPGVFMIYLNIAIIFELFYNNMISKRYLLVFLITSLTTFSTAGFITILILILAFLFKKNNNISYFKSKGFIIFFLGISLLIIGLTPPLYNLIFDKLSNDNLDKGSSLARGISVVANLDIFIDNFLFGSGLKNYPNLFSDYTLSLTGFSMGIGNNTNTITTVFAVYGLMFGCIFIYLLYSISQSFSKSLHVRILILIALVLMYSNEDLRYSLFSSTLLFFGLTKRKKLYENLNN
jgi:hypothetical protein